MLFAVYPRASDQGQERIVLNEARYLLKHNSPESALKHLEQASKNCTDHSKIIFKACKATIALKTFTDNSISDQSMYELKETVEEKLNSLQSIDADIRHDIYSILKHGSSSEDFNNRIIRQLQTLDLETKSPNKKMGANKTQELSWENLKENKIWVIQPPDTGIFSYIEHICNAIYVAKLFGRDLFVDYQHWRYRFAIERITMADDVNNISSKMRHKFKLLSSDRVREVIGQSMNTYRDSLVTFKRTYYKLVRSNIRNQLIENKMGELVNKIDSSNRKENNLTYIFIRRGDKIEKETIETSRQVIVKSMAKCKKIMILTDDNSFARDILRERNQFSDGILLDGIGNGYFHQRNQRKEDIFWETLLKWYAFSGASKVWADADSNWSNTCYYARDSEYKACNAFFIRPSAII